MSREHILLKECEDLIRTGQIESVRKRLLTVPPVRVERPYRQPLANLCRRSGLIALGLKLLNPLIAPDRKKWRTDATPGELAEYAVLLLRNGSVAEALWILKQVDSRQAPDASLYQAFCQFNQWNYEQAISSLKLFIEGPVTAYQQMVGKVNLAAALIATARRAEALDLLNSNIATARENVFTRLLSNCLELRAQLHFQDGRFDDARADLNSAANSLSARGTSDHFWLHKWNLIIDGIESRDAEPIHRLKKEAFARNDWESAREADRYSVQVRFDENLYEHLLFGTPFSPYRKFLIAEHAQRGPQSPFYTLGATDGVIFHLKAGTFSDQSRSAPTESVHRLIDALARDFYRPIAIGGIFAALFPDEHFDIYSSPNRVHQIIHRARAWSKENELGLGISEIAGEYRLEPGQGFGISVPYIREAIRTEDIRLESLRARFQTEDFGSAEARQTLGISPTAFKGLIAEALKSGLVSRSGAGPATRYRFLPVNKLAEDGFDGATKAKAA